MISDKMKDFGNKTSEEAIHILKISGISKDPKETYERAKDTLAMIDIAVRMLISELEENKELKSKLV